MVSTIRRSTPASAERGNLFGEGGAGFIKAGFAEGLETDAERAHGSGDEGFAGLLFLEVVDRLPGDADAGEVDFATLPASPWRPERKRLAPKVLVSMISAPACRYSS